MIATITFLLLLAQHTDAPNPGNDLRGWSKITWGMTVADARAALSPDVTEAPPPEPNLELHSRLFAPVHAGALDGRAAIQTRPGIDRISAVTITFAAGAGTSSGRRAEIFEEAKRLLTEKYGAPRNTQTQPSGGSSHHTAQWFFRYTTVTLLRSESTRYDLGYVTLRYQEKEPNPF